MAVKILTPEEKENILYIYTKHRVTQKALAEMYLVSERTINRVFIEAGIATPVARIKGDAYRAKKLLDQYGITVDQLERILSGVPLHAA